MAFILSIKKEINTKLVLNLEVGWSNLNKPNTKISNLSDWLILNNMHDESQIFETDTQDFIPSHDYNYDNTDCINEDGNLI